MPSLNLSLDVHVLLGLSHSQSIESYESLPGNVKSILWIVYGILDFSTQDQIVAPFSTTTIILALVFIFLKLFHEYEVILLPMIHVEQMSKLLLMKSDCVV